MHDVIPFHSFRSAATEDSSPRNVFAHTIRLRKPHWVAKEQTTLLLLLRRPNGFASLEVATWKTSSYCWCWAISVNLSTLKSCTFVTLLFSITQILIIMFSKVATLLLLLSSHVEGFSTGQPSTTSKPHHGSELCAVPVPDFLATVRNKNVPKWHLLSGSWNKMELTEVVLWSW